jgi:glycosyltransferase involved in cell wall biosynthesis
LLPPFPTRLPWRRHFLWRTGNLFRRLHPGYYRDCVTRLNAFAARHNIDLVLAYTLEISEFAAEIHVTGKIVDIVDSRYLFLSRLRDSTPSKTTTLLGRLRLSREMARARYRESRLLEDFSSVITISARDSATIKSFLSTGKERVFDIPNGVSPELESWHDTNPPHERAIAFWGALDFPPNTTAIHYFYNKVFLPFLNDRNVVWYIVGRNPGPDIEALAKSHSNIIVTGYVPDLFSLVQHIPVVINPMLIGGGMKNKVLEAFAMQRAVVSNALGIEAIDATPGKHYVAAETPEQFAEQVLNLLDNPEHAKAIGRAARERVLERYAWPVIGRLMNGLVERCLAGPPSHEES